MIYRRFSKLLLSTATIVTLFTACTPTQKEHLFFSGKQNLVVFSYEMVDDLVASSIPPILPGKTSPPILVTTPVSNNNLKQTSALSRVLQEQVRSRLVQHGYAVQEIKLQKELTIRPQTGETILSRENSEIASKTKAQAIFTSSYTRAGDTLYISSRLLDPKTGILIAAEEYTLPLDDNTLQLLGLQRSDEIQEPEQPWLNDYL